MATPISTIETLARQRIIEPSPIFWSSAEMVDIVIAGIKDLWRDIVDLKAEHYLTIDNTNVFLAPNTGALSGVPLDVHKVYLIEPRDITESGPHHNLVFLPADFNSGAFQSARGSSPREPSNGVIFYAIHNQGAPVAAPDILIAPQVSSQVLLSFAYVPTLPAMTSASMIPIPGEADNALIAWTVAFARGKEKEDRAPDPQWLMIYATEKQHLLQSLGLRQLQENTFAGAVFESYW